MIMCVLLYYPVSIHMSQLLSTGRPISSYLLIVLIKCPLERGCLLFSPSVFSRRCIIILLKYLS